MFPKCFSFYIVIIFSFGIGCRYSALASLSVKIFLEIFFATILKELSCIVGYLIVLLKFVNFYFKGYLLQGFYQLENEYFELQNNALLHKNCHV